MPLQFESLDLSGLTLMRMSRYADERGSFMETYKRSEFEIHGLSEVFVQDNQSISWQGVIRGFHYQLPPSAQGKLVRVAYGKAFDVAVDVRRSSPTFLKWRAVVLSGENGTMFYIPPGFAHGFAALSDSVHLLYKCTSEYDKASERGIRWNDPEIAVEWPVRSPIISERDRQLPFLREAEIFE